MKLTKQKGKEEKNVEREVRKNDKRDSKYKSWNKYMNVVSCELDKQWHTEK